MSRKIRELGQALAVEKDLAKDEILHRYLNIVYFANGAYGIEAAARRYFGIPASDLTASGIDLHNGDVLHAHVTYDGTTLTLVLSDPQTNAQFTLSQAVDIPGAVGGPTAFVGFTGGTGGTVSTQKILTWTYVAQ